MSSVKREPGTIWLPDELLLAEIDGVEGGMDGEGRGRLDILLSGDGVRGRMHAVSWPRVPYGDAPILHLVAFDCDSFDAVEFGRSSIVRPEHIGRAVRKRQAEYFHGRLCARNALWAVGQDGTVGTGLMREPTWPGGIVGSITHCGTLAAAAVLPSATCRGIGVDIELVVAPDAQFALQTQVVSAREYELLQALAPGIGMAVLLTLVFSAKESFYKAAFATICRFLDFDAIEFRTIDEATGEMTFAVTNALYSSLPAGFPLRVQYAVAADGYVATMFAW